MPKLWYDRCGTCRHFRERHLRGEYVCAHGFPDTSCGCTRYAELCPACQAAVDEDAPEIPWGIIQACELCGPPLTMEWSLAVAAAEAERSLGRDS